MVRLTSIYTRSGDDGSTGLVDGSRIAKSDPLMIAIGDVDEANSAIGTAAALALPEEAAAMLRRIQNEMFDLGADLATPKATGEQAGIQALRILPGQVERLEQEIDAMNERLEPLRSFILPGGTPPAAQTHLARAVVRRAERSGSAAAQGRWINPLALAYLNRLSDHLFVLARILNLGRGDILWAPGATR